MAANLELLAEKFDNVLQYWDAVPAGTLSVAISLNDLYTTEGMATEATTCVREAILLTRQGRDPAEHGVWERSVNIVLQNESDIKNGAPTLSRGYLALLQGLLRIVKLLPRGAALPVSLQRNEALVMKLMHATESAGNSMRRLWYEYSVERFDWGQCAARISRILATDNHCKFDTSRRVYYLACWYNLDKSLDIEAVGETLFGMLGEKRMPRAWIKERDRPILHSHLQDLLHTVLHHPSFAIDQVSFCGRTTVHGLWPSSLHGIAAYGKSPPVLGSQIMWDQVLSRVLVGPEFEFQPQVIYDVWDKLREISPIGWPPLIANASTWPQYDSTLLEMMQASKYNLRAAQDRLRVMYARAWLAHMAAQYGDDSVRAVESMVQSLNPRGAGIPERERETFEQVVPVLQKALTISSGLLSWLHGDFVPLPAAVPVQLLREALGPWVAYYQSLTFIPVSRPKEREI